MPTGHVSRNLIGRRSIRDSPLIGVAILAAIIAIAIFLILYVNS